MTGSPDTPETQTTEAACAGLFATGLGVVTGLVALAARNKLADPSSLPGWFTDSDPEDLRLLMLLTGGMAAFCALLLAGAISALLRGGVAARQPAGRRAPSIPVSPAFLVDGRIGPFNYIDPEQAGTVAGSCLGLTLALGAIGLMTQRWWPLPTWVYVIGGLLLGIGLVHTAWAARSWLAARRLRLRLLDVPDRIRLGEPFEVTGHLQARADVIVDRLRLVLACVEEWTTTTTTGIKGNRSRSTQTHRHVLGHHVQDLETNLELEGGQRKRFRARVKPPLHGWGLARPERRSCWILGVVVDIPNWPDYELAREVEVDREPEADPKPVSLSVPQA
jgi:hypothetical protein